VGVGPTGRPVEKFASGVGDVAEGAASPVDGFQIAPGCAGGVAAQVGEGPLRQAAQPAQQTVQSSVRYRMGVIR
jgi:hypothetical protein